MDLNTISKMASPRHREDIGPWHLGSAWLAGGTWLFSEPQPHLCDLIDLSGMGWAPLELDEHGLRVAATCTLAEFNAFSPPPACRALGLVSACYQALQGSFKVWNTATVGGNICLALPAASMVALTVALEGSAEIWRPDGGERRLPMIDFVEGPQRTALVPGEVLRAVHLPMQALRRLATHRKVSRVPLGRSAALLIGTWGGENGFALTITASVGRPMRLAFPRAPTREALAAAIDAAIPFDLYQADVHGRPAWRRHLTYRLAEEIRAELCQQDPP